MVGYAVEEEKEEEEEEEEKDDNDDQGRRRTVIRFIHVYVAETSKRLTAVIVYRVYSF